MGLIAAVGSGLPIGKEVSNLSVIITSIVGVEPQGCMMDNSVIRLTREVFISLDKVACL